MVSDAEAAMEIANAVGEKSPVDAVTIDLPAPEGWKKKFTPKKGMTGRKNDIMFISPTGDEIRNKRQLDQYLKSHPGGPAASEFDWGTGDTPRRSARLTEKSKATETPESEPPKKLQKRSGIKKGAKEKEVVDGEGETVEEKESAEEGKEIADAQTNNSDDHGDENTGEVAEKVEREDADQKKGEDAAEEPLRGEGTITASEGKTYIQADETNMETVENVKPAEETCDAVEEKVELEENNKVQNGAKPEAAIEALPGPISNENASFLRDVEIAEDADANMRKESENAGLEHQPDTEMHIDIVANAEGEEPHKANLENQEVGKLVDNPSVEHKQQLT